MQQLIRHNCEENDAILDVVIDGEQIQELWIGIQGNDVWRLVTYVDLLKALHKADLAIVKAKRKTKE